MLDNYPGQRNVQSSKSVIPRAKPVGISWRNVSYPTMRDRSTSSSATVSFLRTGRLPRPVGARNDSGSRRLAVPRRRTIDDNLRQIGAQAFVPLCHCNVGLRPRNDSGRRRLVAPTQKNRPIWGGFDQFSVPRTSARELSLRKVSRLYRYSTSVMLWLEIRFSRSP